MRFEQPITYVDKKTPDVTFNEGVFRACRPEHAGDFLVVNAPVENVARIANENGQTGIVLKPGRAYCL